MQRLTISIQILKQLRITFDECKECLHMYFKDESRPPIAWSFHPNVVFERYNAFLERLNTIQW